MLHASLQIPEPIAALTGNPVAQGKMVVGVIVVQVIANRVQLLVRVPGWPKIVKRFAIPVRPAKAQ